MNWIEKQQESLKNDKKETEDNVKKIEERRYCHGTKGCDSNERKV